MSTTSISPLVSESANESFDDLYFSPKQEHNSAGFRDRYAEVEPAHHPKGKAPAAALPEGLVPDLDMAGQYIETLTGNRESVITVQTFSDNEATKIIEADGKKFDPLAKIRHGTLADLAPELVKLNRQGAGIFICVNATNLAGRKAENIAGVRAVWGDFDGANASELALTAAASLPPSIVVESSPGKRHQYWLTSDVSIAGFRPLIDPLTAAIGSDPSARTIERVLRIPGFFHCKGAPVMVRLLSNQRERRYTTEQIVAAFALDSIPTTDTEPREVATFDELAYVLSEQKVADLRSALTFLDAKDRNTWIAVCGALCRSGDPGFKVFHDWSKTAPNDGKHGYQNETDCRAKFLEMAPHAKSAPEAIFKMATEKGWINKPASATASTGFRFVPLRELADSTVNPHWVVKHWLERDTVTCIAGQPKHGKSFSAFDIGLHVAAGIPWCGKRVEQGAVFVIAGEGQGGTSRRTKGWLLKHPEVSKDIPFYVSNKSIQLDTIGAEKTKAIIEDMCKEYGIAPSMIIVDTLARSFPGDENKTEDMNTFVAALDQHLKVMDVALIIVHHSTKSGSDVLRGNSALRGALDGLIEVAKADTPSPTGGILIEVKPHWLKDGQTPTSLFFDCEVVKTGIDEDLEDITTLVPMLTSQPGAAAASLTNIERQALDILRGLQCEDGNIGVKLNEWRKACVEAGLIGGRSPNAIERAMERLCDRLSAANAIFKPSTGKYRAVIYESFDIETPE